MNQNKKNPRLYPVALLGIAIIAALLHFSYNGFIKPDMQRKNYKITMITKSTDSEFFRSVFSGGNAAATEYNVELVTEGPEDEEDFETQNKMIMNAIADGTDAIVLSAVDFNANADAVNEAAGNGIPVVIIDSDVNSRAVSCRISTDNYEAGRMTAEAVKMVTSGLKELNIGIVNFDKNTENGSQREAGFKDAVSEDKRVKSIETTYVLSTIDDADRGTKELLSLNPDINVVVTFNEWTSLGVGRAIDDLGSKDSIAVIAFDSNEESVNMLEMGVVDALIVQNPYAMGYLGVESAYRLIENEQQGSSDINTETTIVTPENMFDPEYQKILFKYE